MITTRMWPTGRWAVVAAALYYLALILISSVPGPELPKVETPGLDKLIHLIFYAGLGWLLAGSGWSLPTVLLVGALAGAADEGFQLMVPGRDASLLDWIADGVGVMMGAWARQRWVPVGMIHER
ncbi:MAG: hypothetical protein OHK005_07050 [Candidatus Methylacidiphilales bacterium]